MKLQILLSCMHKKDLNIIYSSKIHSDTIIINQTNGNEESIYNITTDSVTFKVKMINTTERGLSRSRNMAIRNSDSDICLLCDDDEIYEKDYDLKIIKAFKENPDTDIIAFRLKDEKKDLGNKPMKIGLLRASRVCSVQIAFRRESISKNDISFDPKMGSGSGNGAGEENKFLVDCLKKGLKIKYIPYTIAMVDRSKSLWFNGFTEKYFKDLAWSTRRIYSDFLAYLYLYFFAIRHYKIYKSHMSFFSSLKYMHIGFFENR